MKKNTRAHIANQGPRKRRTLRLVHETVRVLRSADLAQAAGGSGCITTTWTTQTNTSLDSEGGGGSQQP